MPAQLISLNDGPSILLDKPILLVGRHPECDIQIDSRKVSRRHCCIAQVDDHLVVRDLGSTNGVRINGVRVQEGRLKASDELAIGGTRFRVSWDIVPEMPLHSEQRARRKEELRELQRPAAALDPKQLESWDEPVALPEPDGLPVAVPIAVPQAPPRPPGPLIPEALKLAPSSDGDLAQNSQAS
jgi:pSer/pThr/pTyr-binding forkhead associated (FHA) protein